MRRSKYIIIATLAIGSVFSIDHSLSRYIEGLKIKKLASIYTHTLGI